MKKKHWNDKTALIIIRITALINYLLIHILWGLSAEFRAIKRVFRDIPISESVQDIQITLFKTIYVTDKTEYVSNNAFIISVAAFLAISFLVMLVVLGLYFSSHDKNKASPQAMENGSSTPLQSADE